MWLSRKANSQLGCSQFVPVQAKITKPNKQNHHHQTTRVTAPLALPGFQLCLNSAASASALRLEFFLHRKQKALIQPLLYFLHCSTCCPFLDVPVTMCLKQNGSVRVPCTACPLLGTTPRLSTNQVQRETICVKLSYKLSLIYFFLNLPAPFLLLSMPF